VIKKVAEMWLKEWLKVAGNSWKWLEVAEKY